MLSLRWYANNIKKVVGKSRQMVYFFKHIVTCYTWLKTTSHLSLDLRILLLAATFVASWQILILTYLDVIVLTKHLRGELDFHVLILSSSCVHFVSLLASHSLISFLELMKVFNVGIHHLLVMYTYIEKYLNHTPNMSINLLTHFFIGLLKKWLDNLFWHVSIQ